MKTVAHAHSMDTVWAVLVLEESCDTTTTTTNNNNNITTTTTTNSNNNYLPLERHIETRRRDNYYALFVGRLQLLMDDLLKRMWAFPSA